jgi:hypothetical protein
MINNNWDLIPFVEFAIQREEVTGIELVKSWRSSGIQHGYMAHGPIRTRWPGNNATGFVWVISAGM